jgi:cobalt-zinc-cadmium efflux system outer membrane protein
VERAAADIQSRTAELHAELQRLVTAYLAVQQTLTLYDQGWREAAGEALRIAEFSYLNGEIALLELLDAQRSAISVGLEEADARATLAMTRMDIERLLGGALQGGTLDAAE